MQKYCYIRASGVRKLAKDNSKNCSADFLNELDIFIYDSVLRACKTFNGHRKRLTREIAQVVLGKLKI